MTKPPFGAPCTQCGLCCRLALCDLGAAAFPGAAAPCPALEWEDGKAWCGMVRHPSRHLLAPYNIDEILRPMMTAAIPLGQGCGMEDDEGGT